MRRVEKNKKEKKMKKTLEKAKEKLKTYCEKKLTSTDLEHGACMGCACVNYGRDCHNNRVMTAMTLADWRKEDADRKAAGLAADRWGNEYVPQAEADNFFNN
jgi:hypothetical protein